MQVDSPSFWLFPSKMFSCQKQEGPPNKWFTCHPTPSTLFPSPFSKEGREGIPFDIRIDGNLMDLASPQGFANALWAVANLKPGSGHLTAPVCSSFVFVFLSCSEMGVVLLIMFWNPGNTKFVLQIRVETHLSLAFPKKQKWWKSMALEIQNRDFTTFTHWGRPLLIPNYAVMGLLNQIEGLQFGGVWLLNFTYVHIPRDTLYLTWAMSLEFDSNPFVGAQTKIRFDPDFNHLSLTFVP